jgi:UPF0755 protein
VVGISLMMVFLGLVVMVIVVYNLYGRIFASNVSMDAEQQLFYIPTGSDSDDVIDALEKEGIIDNRRSFRWVAIRKGYEQSVKPGRYKIRSGLSNNELVNMLRSGDQDPVMVVFNNVRTLDQLAGRVSRYLEGDSAEFAAFFSVPGVAEKYGFDQTTFTSMFIPNTYEFFWTATPGDFVERMNREYQDFWKGERDRKARKMNMTRIEVVTVWPGFT